MILGLSSFRHDAAAALLQDGVIKAAIENDKLSRTHTRGLPEYAIRFCLEKLGSDWHEVEAIAVATRPFCGWMRRSLLRARLSPFSPVASAYYEAHELGVLARQMNNLRLLRQNGTPAKVVNFEDHLCHAANAFYLSPFERALILTLDEQGDGLSGMMAVGEGTDIRTLRTIPFPHSLGWIYSQLTDLLGLVPQHDEHKTQWLSLEGEPVFKEVFLEMFRNPRNHLPRLNYSYFNRGLAGRLTFSSKFYRAVGLTEGSKDISDDQRRALASSLQHACTEVIGSLVEHFREREGIQSVCLAGGLFQNALLVASLEKRLGLDTVFVPPAPGNSGCAVGAAALLHHRVLRKPRMAPVTQVYGGPAFSRSEIRDVLENCKARYSLQTTEERKLDAVLQLLHSGKIVGWFQGAAEFGPRALGNRSLLASPWAAYVRENLNDYIKHREWFRPFAVAVPEEDAPRYFESSRLCQSMNSLAWARTDSAVLPEGFILPGNMVRLHVVQQQSNPLFWRLLKRFGEHAPAPILVNTSFNLFGEPLVVKPRDAVRSYFCSGMDALMIDNFVLSKAAVSQTFAPRAAETLVKTG
jgi:carbamoyltransferase